MKPITDEKKIEEVLSRGVEKIYPDFEKFREMLKSGRRLRLYCGFDPSAKALHIGNAILINKLRQFQELGHQVIFLIGDFTGTIGDPTDKTAARTKLSRDQVRENARDYQKQASGWLDFEGDNKAEVMHNSMWQDKLNFADLVELSTHFTVQQMIQRDMFQERIKAEKPIYMHEFLYPLAQAYDSVAMEVDLEIGGNDQMFNMMAGRDLMKSMGMKEKYVMTLKLLTDAEGSKMGKTTGNAVYLDQEPKDIYGSVMSWPDEVIIPGFELTTKLPWGEVKAIAKELEGGANPRDAKMKLAFELTKTIAGEEAAKQAADNFRQTIQQSQAPEEMIEVDMPESESLLEAIYESYDNKQSKSQLRRLFEQGAVEVNGEKVDSWEAKAKSGDTVKVGKRHWFKIK